ncbi:MAG: M24 family metallopeptidase [Proteobacteria bacterium]|nr:M24 family metallopeptidase [Pseudomonadota bacterium]
MSQNKRIARALYGHGSNNYYAIRVEVPDAYVWYRDTKGKTHVIMSALEYDRVKKYAKVDVVHAMDDVVAELTKLQMPTDTAGQIAWLVMNDKLPGGLTSGRVFEGVDVLEVPSDFPFGLAAALIKMGITVEPVKGHFFPERSLKSQAEVDAIRHAQWVNEQGHERARVVLREATIGKDDVLMWNGKVLTSEILAGEINAEIARHGGVPAEGGPIVACGEHSADPHERGHGPLKAYQFIIIDSWPRADFYHGDLTRTYIKGKATAQQQAMYDAVKDAQQLGLDMANTSANPAAIHQAIEDLLTSRGFKTGKDANGNNCGFFHGTGHSVGLNVHDQGPGIHRRNTTPLPEGTVVTVEPGVYYQGIGGVRIEDIIAITATGNINLTTFDKELVIP